VDLTDLLARNAEFAKDFALGDLPAPPALRLAIVTCMDARIDPLAALGLRPGDAHIIRNAGGVVTDDTVRTLSISQHELGTDTVMLMHHTRCGMQTFTDEDFASARELSRGARPPWPVQTFTDLEQDVRDSIDTVRASPFVPHKNIRGFVYDVDTGLIREVEHPK
jgi:carbonic anhydrase